MTISDYLLQRGLTLEPTQVDTDLILDEPEFTKEVADLWQGHKNAITQVIQARVNAVGRVILRTARPEEVLVLRQALVEVAAVLDDFAKYAGVQERREQPKGNQGEQEPEHPPGEVEPQGEGEQAEAGL